MPTPNDARDFLVSRRAKVSPEQAGLPAYGGNRRVPGLRREEVALLAGVSVDYYNKLERGNLSGVSESVLDAIARALQLDEAEAAHLHDLARASGRSPVRGTSAGRAGRGGRGVRPSVQHMLDAMTDAPAWVRNARHDLLAANRLGFALYSELFFDEVRPANTARFLFLSERSRRFFRDWDRSADDIVAMLRSEAGRAPHDRGLSELVGELSMRSDDFRRRWARHDVRFHRTGAKKLHHPIIGDLELSYEAMTLSSDPDLTFLAYTAAPGTASADALTLLASWAATLEIDAGRATVVVPDARG